MATGETAPSWGLWSIYEPLCRSRMLLYLHRFPVLCLGLHDRVDCAVS